MRPFLVWFTLTSLACATSPESPESPVDPEAGSAKVAAGCYAVHISGRPAPDVSLPSFIELSTDPAPGFVTPGRLAVREPRATTPSAPLSWWIPRASAQIELVLGGGYTGYTFSLRSAGHGWEGQGSYFADFGVEPAPSPLGLELASAACP